MLDSTILAQSLTAFAALEAPNTGAAKTANAFTLDAIPVENQTLQVIVGDPGADPLSWGAQYQPSEGDAVKLNPLSPVQGDDIFFTGLMDGARFQANDGSWWDIESYDWEGVVTIRNVWYPRNWAVVSVQDIRQSIHSWIEPFLQRVPPPPPGVDYGVLHTKSVN